MNRKVHSTIRKPPFEEWWDRKPDLSGLRTFGSSVCVKITGKRNAKLDRHDFSGIFIGYTATDDNIKYIDVDTGRVKTSHHAVFDEAWYLQKHRPPAAQLLYDMGMESEEHFQQAAPTEPRPQAPYPMVTDKPLQETPKGAKQNLIPLRLSAAPQQQQYAAAAATLQLPKDFSWFDTEFNKVDIIKDMALNKKETFAQIYLSPLPYFDAFEEMMNIRHWNTLDHKCAGLNLLSRDDRPIVGAIQPSTPAAKIPRWRSRIRGAWLLEVDGKAVHSKTDIFEILAKMKDEGREDCKLLFAHPEIKDGLTNEGIPQISIDQLNARYILNAENLDRQESPQFVSGGVYQYVFSKLTRGKLIKQPDWNEWQEAEWKQLDQYWSQFMFREPVQVQSREHVFHLVWTYKIKDEDGRKKARCACDGSTRGGKARILDHTHGNCVDHTASWMFYAIAAAETLKCYGGDVSNAFAKAPPPKQGFFVQPDRALREWWVHCGHEPIPDGWVLPVLKAMQGHPESPRLWEKHCDKIIRSIGFQPTTHEPCLYWGIVKGKKCYFMRQVDDFAVATDDVEAAHWIFDRIDDGLSMPIRRMGLISLFNGVDILQSRYYVKVSVQTYIEKMTTKYANKWQKDVYRMWTRPLPVPTGETYWRQFLLLSSPKDADRNPDVEYQEKMKKEFGFGYRNGVGEAIWAMVTCRPDISTAVVKCAQNSACPHEVHYKGVKHLLKYLWCTRT